jgi:hypothetical protein
MTELDWAPAVGTTIAFTTGPAADYRLLSMDGLGSVVVSPMAVKSPGQAGETAVDMVVSPRHVTAQALIQGDSMADLWSLRADLAGAMSASPLQSGETLALGKLTLKRGLSLADLEIYALPFSAHLPSPKSSVGLLGVDLEWLCPSPYWRTTSDTVVQIPTVSTPVNVANTGDVTAWPVIRIYGDLTGVHVYNLTTGKDFALSGQIVSGEYVDIDMTPGARKITYSVGPTNWMSHLDLANADLFGLAPGTNSIQWTRSAAGVSGNRRVDVTFRKQYSGI